MTEFIEKTEKLEAVKDVSVCGIPVKAGKDATGTVWVSVRSVCQALGIDRKGQQRKLEGKVWAVLKGWGQNVPESSSEQSEGHGGRRRGAGNNDETYLRADRSAMWLATVSVNACAEEAQDRLMTLQCEMADVLARHFTPQFVAPLAVCPEPTYVTMSQWAALRGRDLAKTKRFALALEAVAESARHGADVARVPHPKFGTVNSYRLDIADRVFGR